MPQPTIHAGFEGLFGRRRLHQSIQKNRPVGGFFSFALPGGGNRTRGRGGFSGVSGSIAPRRKSALRLQAQGSPIRLTRGKSPGDFLPFASTSIQKIAAGDFVFQHFKWASPLDCSVRARMSELTPIAGRRCSCRLFAAAGRTIRLRQDDPGDRIPDRRCARRRGRRHCRV